MAKPINWEQVAKEIQRNWCHNASFVKLLDEMKNWAVTQCGTKGGPNWASVELEGPYFCELGKGHKHPRSSWWPKNLHAWKPYSTQAWVFWQADPVILNLVKEPHTWNYNGSWKPVEPMSTRIWNDAYDKMLAEKKKLAFHANTPCMAHNGPRATSLQAGPYNCELGDGHSKGEGWALDIHAWYDHEGRSWVFWTYKLSSAPVKKKKLGLAGAIKALQEDQKPFITNRCQREEHETCDHPNCKCHCHEPRYETEVYVRNVKPQDALKVTDLRGHQEKLKVLGVTRDGQEYKVFVCQPGEKVGNLFGVFSEHDRLRVFRPKKKKKKEEVKRVESKAKTADAKLFDYDWSYSTYEPPF